MLFALFKNAYRRAGRRASPLGVDDLIFGNFIPDYVFPGLYDIPVEFYKKLDVRLLILDVDNTLVPDGYPRPDGRAKDLVSLLNKNGIRTVICSNNSFERVSTFADGFDGVIPYGYKCGKPRRSSLDFILKNTDVQASHVAFVGDQILTDVIAAKKNGVIAVYVAPMDPGIENGFFHLKRMIEKPFLRYYFKKHPAAAEMNDTNSERE